MGRSLQARLQLSKDRSKHVDISNEMWYHTGRGSIRESQLE
nr:MAG TPA: hypothetical protein [Bacteriophage sp.]